MHFLPLSLLRASSAWSTAFAEEWLLGPDERTLRLSGVVGLVLGMALLTGPAG